MLQILWFYSPFITYKRNIPSNIDLILSARKSMFHFYYYTCIYTSYNTTLIWHPMNSERCEDHIVAGTDNTKQFSKYI